MEDDFDSPADWEEFAKDMAENELDRFMDQLLEDIDSELLIHLTEGQDN
jgi:hypothetical protein